MITNQRMTPMENEEIIARVPAVSQTVSAGHCSDRYAFISTLAVVEALRSSGWFPVHAVTQRTRKSGRDQVCKHAIAFKYREQPGNFLKIANGLYPEIVMVNSHDGTGAYKLSMGLFRLICSNGLIIADSVYNSISIRHTGDAPEIAFNAGRQIYNDGSKVFESVPKFQAIELTSDEQGIYARSAIAMKHGIEDKEKVQKLFPHGVLKVRHWEDKRPTLWNVFNTVQENLMKGSYFFKLNKNRGRRIDSINENMRVNKELWHMTEEFYKLKTSN
jgi:hypothetical protein